MTPTIEVTRAESGISRTQIINEMSKSVHGKLDEYRRVIGDACRMDPEFVAHLIAWDAVNGQVKDTKVALPVLTVASREYPDELVENSLAHVVMQSPREMLRALRFSIESGALARRQKRLEEAIRLYLAAKEKNVGKWSRLAARHRRSLKGLYALTHAKAAPWAGDVLFRNVYAPGSVFADIKALGTMDAGSAAAAIAKWKLSPLVVSGAMAGSKSASDSGVVQATMEQMSDTEVVTRAASLEKKGLSRDAALKETFRKKVAKAVKSGKATLKTGVAAEEVEDDGLKEMLRELQERQIQAQKDSGRGIEGNWLVIADKSGTMEAGIELARHVAAAISKFVTGKVSLVFCDVAPVPLEVTGMGLDEISRATRFIKANGGTSMGIGLEWAGQNRIVVDGIVVISDGEENTAPAFGTAYAKYKGWVGKEPPVYYYRVKSGGMTYSASPDTLMHGMRVCGVPVTEFDLRHGAIDYYSVPNLVQGMSVNRFGVVEKIMACPLVTLDRVLAAV